MVTKRSEERTRRAWPSLLTCLFLSSFFLLSPFFLSSLSTRLSLNGNKKKSMETEPGLNHHCTFFLLSLLSLFLSPLPLSFSSPSFFLIRIPSWWLLNDTPYSSFPRFLLLEMRFLASKIRRKKEINKERRKENDGGKKWRKKCRWARSPRGVAATAPVSLLLFFLSLSLSLTFFLIITTIIISATRREREREREWSSSLSFFQDHDMIKELERERERRGKREERKPCIMLSPSSSPNLSYSQTSSHLHSTCLSFSQFLPLSLH